MEDKMTEGEGAPSEERKNRRKRKVPQKVELAGSSWRETREEDSLTETRLENCIPRSTCPVCGDKANGLHYGIYTCEGCKNFFKRSVVICQERPYICKLNNDCDVGIYEADGIKRQRMRCQACRYQACLDAGMHHIGLARTRVGRPSKKDIYKSSYTDSNTASPSVMIIGNTPMDGVDDDEEAATSPTEEEDPLYIRFSNEDLKHEIDMLRSKNRELSSAISEKDNQLLIAEKQILNLKTHLKRYQDLEMRSKRLSASPTSSPHQTTTNGRTVFQNGNVTITPIFPGVSKSPGLENGANNNGDDEDMATIEAVSNNAQQPATTIKRWKINTSNLMESN